MDIKWRHRNGVQTPIMIMDMFVDDQHTYIVSINEVKHTLNILRVFSPLRSYAAIECEYAALEVNWIDKSLEQAKQLCVEDYKNGTWEQAKNLAQINHILQL
jgi:hypothetical protein